jgi:hypothetical protein
VLLMALTVISTAAAAVSALAAIGLFPQRGAKPAAVVIVVNDVKAWMVEPELRTLGELAARRQDELRGVIEGESIMHAMGRL